MAKKNETRKQLGGSNLHRLNVNALVEAGYKIENIIKAELDDESYKNSSKEIATVLKKGNKVVVMFYPVKDTDRKKDNSKDYSSLKTVLKGFDFDALKTQYLGCEIQAQIPVAETFIRNHWTLLSLDIPKAGSNEPVKANFHDSKGWISFLYPLTYIKGVLKDTFKKSFTFKREFLGQQGFFDNVNCGRFVHRYIKALVIEGVQKLRDLVNPSKDFGEYDASDKTLSTKELDEGEGEKYLSDLLLEEQQAKEAAAGIQNTAPKQESNDFNIAEAIGTFSKSPVGAEATYQSRGENTFGKAEQTKSAKEPLLEEFEKQMDLSTKN